MNISEEPAVSVFRVTRHHTTGKQSCQLHHCENSNLR